MRKDRTRRSTSSAPPKSMRPHLVPMRACPTSPTPCTTATSSSPPAGIGMHRKRVNVSTVLAGQRLGIKEVDEGVWLVSFMSYDLGFIDLEQKTLQPLDNPFGPRLSPMS
jgi:hypothetical protein